MDPITLGLIIGGSQLAGSALNFFGSQKAAEQQTQAQQAAIAAQMQMFQQVMGQVSPYTQFAQNSMGMLSAAMPQLTSQPTMQDAMNTPGWEFALGQGLESTQSGFAAKGLASSGSAIRGAGQYERGLAQQMILPWLQQLQANKLQAYNMLYGPVATGADVTKTLMGQTTQTGANIATNLGNIGQAQAAGTMSGYGGIASALTNAPASVMQGMMINKLMAGNAAGTSPATPAGPYSPVPAAGPYTADPFSGYNPATSGAYGVPGYAGIFGSPATP
jgi:hypothetical protein